MTKRRIHRSNDLESEIGMINKFLRKYFQQEKIRYYQNSQRYYILTTQAKIPNNMIKEILGIIRLSHNVSLSIYCR